MPCLAAGAEANCCGSWRSNADDFAEGVGHLTAEKMKLQNSLDYKTQAPLRALTHTSSFQPCCGSVPVVKK
jgi:hypothetical protein